MKKPIIPKKQKKQNLQNKKRAKRINNENQVQHVIKEEKTSLNKFWFLLLASIIFAYFMPDQIAYSKYGVGILLFLMLAVLPYSISKIMKSFYGEGEITSLCVLLLPLFFLGTSVFYQLYKEEKELKLHGKVTKCFVIDRKKVSGKSYYNIYCNYFVDGKEFTANDSENTIEYKIGDTLELTYNKKFPRSHRINLE